MPGDLQYITIDDFRPGIQHRTFGVGDSSRTPLGAADPSNTFRCCALPWGGLGPLPKMVESYTKSHDEAAEDGVWRIVGFHVTGPIQETDNSSSLAGVDPVEVHVCYEYHMSDGAHKFRWQRVAIWRVALTETNISTFTVSHPGSFDENYRAASLVDARMHDTDQTALGDIFVVCGWSPDDMDATSNFWKIFPDPTTPGANGVQEILDVNETTILVQHQGRVISIDRHVFQHGGAGYWVVNDQLVYTQVNLPTVEMDGATVLGVAVYTQGPVSGYGAAVSSSAQELLLVKHRGGATILSGDIDSPTVFSFPGVQSTRGALTFGVYTPLGFVYGVLNGGVFVWGGGDSSEKLSVNLEDTFWQMRPSDWTDFDGKFDIWNDYILLPNNWLYSIPTQSWWRLENPETYQIFQWAASPVSPMFYGAPVSCTDGGVKFYRFDGETLEDSYVWQSQYLPISIDRVMDIREIRLRALSPNGVSFISVTLTDEEGHTVKEDFTVEETAIPKLLRMPTSLKGMGIKVTVEAHTDGGVAPILHELHLGYQSAQREMVH